jgi:cytochrome P450
MDKDRITLETLDISDQDRFEANTYHPLFKRLRHEDPVHHCISERFGSYWSITRYKDILEIEKNHRDFSSDAKHGGVTIKDHDFEDVLDIGSSFITMDRPRHTAHRGAVAPLFRPVNIQNLEPEIRKIVLEILQDLPLAEEFDWVDKVANLLPIRVLALLFGVPEKHSRKLLRWSNLFVGTDDPDVVESRSKAGEELAQFVDYFLAMRTSRSGTAPGGDLISLLVHGAATRDMSEDDFISTMILLLIGGNDTTRNTISGGLWALTQNPEQYALLRRKPDLVPAATDEMIRWVTPIHHMRRTATCDTELRGKRIRAGDKLVLWYVSGNRDEEVFQAADQFRVARKGPKHLAFGAGIHYCIGSRIAQMQLRILWEELLERFPPIEATAEPARLWSNFINGIKTLPVRFLPH